MTEIDRAIAFLETISGPFGPNDAVPAAALDAAEARLGVRLPTALRLLYAWQAVQGGLSCVAVWEQSAEISRFDVNTISATLGAPAFETETFIDLRAWSYASIRDE